MFLLFLFQQLAKEALALYVSTILELNIAIKNVPETMEIFPLFADYIESWRVTCWKTIFLNYSNGIKTLWKTRLLISSIENF